jgi:hypothetical protein
MIRDHKIFILRVEKDTRDRVEDDFGELKSYTEPYRKTETQVVIASSTTIAAAYIRDLYKPDNPKM